MLQFRAFASPQGALPAERGTLKSIKSSAVAASVRPVRGVFQRFLTDDDVVRLQRVSRTFSRDVLRGYTFTTHLFAPSDMPRLQTLTSWANANEFTLRRLALPEDSRRLCLSNGKSPIPASITTLSVGVPPDADESMDSVRLCRDMDFGLPKGFRDFLTRPCADGFTPKLEKNLIPGGVRVLNYQRGLDSPYTAIYCLKALSRCRWVRRSITRWIAENYRLRFWP